MRSLVDAHLIGSCETGNETYIKNILRSLVTIPGVECGAALLPHVIIPNGLSSVEPLRLRSSNDWSRLLYGLPQTCRQWRADVVHVTYIAPFWVPCPLVVTVHDVSFKRYPKLFSARDRLLFSTLLPWSMQRANAIITVSEHARSEIVEFYPHVRDKIHVTHEAPDPQFRPVTDKTRLETTRSRFGIRSTFVLAVGDLQPRKNIVRLIRAFARIRAEFESMQLVVVGKVRSERTSWGKVVCALGLSDHVIFTGYVPDDQLVLLYNAAQLFVYPSIYEGFGLPILEAMACGVPVVTSNTSSMPEVAGEAALLIDPFNESQIAAAMLRVLQSPDLSRKLARDGLHRAEQFAWHRTAKQTFRAYQAAVSNLSRS